jgi:nucleoid-associated protein YgaU
MTAPGGPYGQRQALEQQQAAAPLARAQAAPPSGRVPMQLPTLNAFGPTARPGEPVTRGLPGTNQIVADDPDVLLRALYAVYPHPDIQRLIG